MLGDRETGEANIEKEEKIFEYIDSRGNRRSDKECGKLAAPGGECGNYFRARAGNAKALAARVPSPRPPPHLIGPELASDRPRIGTL